MQSREVAGGLIGAALLVYLGLAVSVPTLSPTVTSGVLIP